MPFLPGRADGCVGFPAVSGQSALCRSARLSGSIFIPLEPGMAEALRPHLSQKGPTAISVSLIRRAAAGLAHSAS